MKNIYIKVMAFVVALLWIALEPVSGLTAALAPAVQMHNWGTDFDNVEFEIDDAAIGEQLQQCLIQYGSTITQKYVRQLPFAKLFTTVPNIRFEYREVYKGPMTNILRPGNACDNYEGEKNIPFFTNTARVHNWFVKCKICVANYENTFMSYMYGLESPAGAMSFVRFIADCLIKAMVTDLFFASLYGVQVEGAEVPSAMNFADGIFKIYSDCVENGDISVTPTGPHDVETECEVWDDIVDNLPTLLCESNEAVAYVSYKRYMTYCRAHRIKYPHSVGPTDLGNCNLPEICIKGTSIRLCPIKDWPENLIIIKNRTDHKYLVGPNNDSNFSIMNEGCGVYKLCATGKSGFGVWCKKDAFTFVNEFLPAPGEFPYSTEIVYE